MSKDVQIGNTIYTIPEEGDKAGWGEDTTAWMEGVTDALADVQGPNDILLTSQTLANNISTPTNIPGLSFNTGQVQSIIVDYFVIRTYNPGAGVQTLTETGTIKGDFNGTDFNVSHDINQDAGIDITVTSAGQFQYTTSDLTGHISTSIRYRAKTIDQP